MGINNKNRIKEKNSKNKRRKIKVSIRDTARQEKFQNIVKQYYNSTKGVLLYLI